MARPIPAGFREVRSRNHRIVFDADFEADLEARGWLAAGGFSSLEDGEVDATGRGETVRCRFPNAGVSVLVRNVLHGGLFGSLLRGALHSPERAFLELRVTAALHSAGAPVPRVVLAAARRSGLAWNARLATVFEEDTRDVVDFLATRPESGKVVAAAGACGRAIRHFHDAGGTHADLHLKNLLLRESGEDFEAIVVDLDGAGFGDPPDPGRRMHELGRLYRSGLKRGLTDQIDFEANRALLHGYVGEDAALGAALSRAWPRERRRVAAHTLGYKKTPRS